ncbi:DUF1961 family protein [Wenyingzhuangia sp. chi5]|uniref:DUF1961 family protein n=1 Tax=Wenyingzhuangia gilva TaxID=3057677 RepID=A0ABT8VU29_9FLAO|nr:DUF1961 family protein [Wenyingzhuangia sp. chi5]MDO3695447.1 DUF1961 family protein [Wenyingzhuangia sp. chi5]
MIKQYFLLISFLLITQFCYSQNNEQFHQLNNSKNWSLKFKDDGTENWKTKWFLDGLRAQVKNTKEGMVFSAGKIERNDSCHAVLWTKKSFKGTIKIEYNYTRKDSTTKWVNILYIQATGIGKTPYTTNISKWNDLRKVPAMSTYYKNMKTLHISYAAYGSKNTDAKNDYIRVRQYPVLEGQNFNTSTEINPAYFNTDLFIPNETYKITVIKTNTHLYFNVAGKNNSKLFTWKLPKNKVEEGRIGLRHMFTRSAQYYNFKVYTQKQSSIL